LNLQPKLLRAVENQEIQPVGTTKTYKVTIRLVAATNCDLRAMMKAGQFREDLFYRFNSVALRIPPLRERAVAIPCFAAHFIERYDLLFGKKVRHISREALTALSSYPWPGNIRELAHVIETAVLMTDSDRRTLSDLPALIATGARVHQLSSSEAVRFGDPEVDRVISPSTRMTSDWSGCEDSQLLLDNVIKRALIRSLEQTQGNRRRAADLLGISRSTLYRMLERYQLGDKTGGDTAHDAPLAGLDSPAPH
jgi:DNA-binding NtrC family response regulator